MHGDNLYCMLANCLPIICCDMQIMGTALVMQHQKVTYVWTMDCHNIKGRTLRTI